MIVRSEQLLRARLTLGGRNVELFDISLPSPLGFLPLAVDVSLRVGMFPVVLVDEFSPGT